MFKFIQSRSAWEIITVSALSFFAIVGFVMATTTIGTNITTGGAIYATSTLYVDGASTFTNTVTLSAANLKVSPGYGLDTASAGVLNIGTTTASSVNIGSLTGITAVGGRITVPAAYGLDTASAGVLNIGTTTANRINIGSATAPVVIANASSTLANFGSGTTVAGLMHGTCANVTIASVAASTTAVFDCAVTGMDTTWKIFVTPNITDINMIFSSASTTATGFQIAVYNTGWVSGIPGTATGLTSHNWSWFAIK